MMGAMASKRLNWPRKQPLMSKIPTKLTEKQFMEHIDPYLSQAKRGFTCQIPRYKVFNYILYWLHTGCQWEEIPITPVPGSEKKKSATVPSTFTFLTGATMGV
jgi:hypothetical protein